MDQLPAPGIEVQIPPPRHFIDNRQMASANGQTIPVIDPSDGRVFASLARGNAEDIDCAVNAAVQAREGAWGRMALTCATRRLRPQAGRSQNQTPLIRH